MSCASESSASPLSAILLVVSVLACVAVVAVGVGILLHDLRAIVTTAHCVLPYCPVYLPQR